MTLLYEYETLVEIELGKILCIPLFQVAGNQEFHPALIKNLAKQIQKKERNYLPVIVKLLAEDSYEAIYNVQILEAARQAEVDFVWCIVVDDEILDQIKVESGEIIRLPVLTASEQDIAEVLDYIKEQKSGVRKMNTEKAAKAIVEQREKTAIKNLNFLTKQRCGIGKATLEKIKPYLVLN
ncbi:MAG: hypothetical protein QNJ70_08180 [Xenococcaceae cyanobacterium MO_207.B15]|nr:hypothetical protein [Xenococcaceae cyanobacterium MO_207.B15]